MFRNYVCPGGLQNNEEAAKRQRGLFDNIPLVGKLMGFKIGGNTGMIFGTGVFLSFDNLVTNSTVREVEEESQEDQKRYKAFHYYSFLTAELIICQKTAIFINLLDFFKSQIS